MKSSTYSLFSGIGLVVLGILICIFKLAVNGITLGVIWGLAFATIIAGMVLDKVREQYYEQIFEYPMNELPNSRSEERVLLGRNSRPQASNYTQNEYSRLKRRYNAVSTQYRPYY